MVEGLSEVFKRQILFIEDGDICFLNLVQSGFLFLVAVFLRNQDRLRIGQENLAQRIVAGSSDDEAGNIHNVHKIREKIEKRHMTIGESSNHLLSQHGFEVGVDDESKPIGFLQVQIVKCSKQDFGHF